LTQNIEIGISFDFGVSQESERGLALGPRLPFTAATDDLANTGETAGKWTLTLGTNLTATSTIPNVYMVRDPSDWTGMTNTPYTNRTNSGDESILIENMTDASDTWVLNDNETTYDLVWEFDFLTTGYSGAVSQTALAPTIRPMHNMVNSPTWSGLFQFHLYAASAISMEISSALFSGEIQPWHSGFMGEELRQRARAVHCYITGQPYMSHLAVEDGFRDHVMVHRDNRDPADPLDTDYFVPPPSEGVVNDEIDNIE
jgi:hypothetical protein